MHICICTSVGSSGGNFDGHNITEEVGLLQRLQVILGYNYVYPNTLRCASRYHIIYSHIYMQIQGGYSVDFPHMQYGIFGGNRYSITIFITLVPAARACRYGVVMHRRNKSSFTAATKAHLQQQQKLIYGNICCQTQEIIDCGVSVFLKLSLCMFYNNNIKELTWDIKEYIISKNFVLLSKKLALQCCIT